jgi:hypothetical protein
MTQSDVRHTASGRPVPRTVDVAYLPSAYQRASADPLRALAFWIDQHPYDAPAETEQERAELRRERISALARLVPQLHGLARDPRPSVRATFATCFSILARAGQAPADREVWRTLLGLAKYDADAEVRAAAERALDDFEHCGTVARAS